MRIFRRAIMMMGMTALMTSSLAAQETLKTALDGTFAPHAMPKMSGGIEGFNVDLNDAIAAKLKKKITLDAAQFSGLIPALQAGTYDFILAPVTVTKERADNMLFTEMTFPFSSSSDLKSGVSFFKRNWKSVLR